jgi:hypothetical protein
VIKMKTIIETLRPYAKIVKSFDDYNEARDYLLKVSDMGLGTFVALNTPIEIEVFAYRNGKYISQYTTVRKF